MSTVTTSLTATVRQKCSIDQFFLAKTKKFRLAMSNRSLWAACGPV